MNPTSRQLFFAAVEELEEKMQEVAKNAFQALRLRDYARIDLRVTPNDEIYVIEANPNCYLEEKSEFAMSAAAAGLDYAALINRIADLALERRGRGKKPVRKKARAVS